ncbi:MAG: GNAT family N-acetyltransferase [Deltaproteobacteria bacterium]|nr:GNAT family N-acetyltransferase [Deltaproteobacteria bacterium]
MLRNLEPQDFDPLSSILRRTGAFTAPEVDCALELLETVLKQPEQRDYLVTVAEEDHAVAGYILYGPIPLTEKSYDIYWIAVDPDLQGRHIGRQLLRATEADILQRGGGLICIETSSQSGYAGTRQFYLHNDYLEESRIRDFYRPGDDRITYVKRFTGSKEVA